MWWTKASGLDDRNKLSGLDLIEAFDAWLTVRLEEAHKAGKDLAFFDTNLRPADGGRFVGWSHILLEPGCTPPPGQDWTIYRLQTQPIAH